MIKMLLKDGTLFTLDDEGYVLARSDGPEGWDYRKGWRIVGFKTRHNARTVIPIAAVLDGEAFGQGWVCDWDHGSYRMWGSPKGRKLAKLTRCEP